MWYISLSPLSDRFLKSQKTVSLILLRRRSLWKPLGDRSPKVSYSDFFKPCSSNDVLYWLNCRFCIGPTLVLPSLPLVSFLFLDSNCCSSYGYSFVSSMLIYYSSLDPRIAPLSISISNTKLSISRCSAASLFKKPPETSFFYSSKASFSLLTFLYFYLGRIWSLIGFDYSLNLSYSGVT